MRRSILTVAALALAALALAPASAPGFGLKELDVAFENEDGTIAPQAGAHPFAMTTTLGFDTAPNDDAGFELPDGDPRNLRISQMTGLVGNPDALPSCTNTEFLNHECPRSSQVGVNEVTQGEPGLTELIPVYSLERPPGVAMKLGFTVIVVPITIEVGVNESPPTNIVASLTNIPNALPVYRSALTLWGVPADSAHDAQRGGSVPLAPEPFLTAPRACTGPLSTGFEADSWQEPGNFFRESILTHDEAIPPNPQAMVGCGKLGFGPTITAKPTSRAASSPTGLDFSLDVDNQGLINPDGISAADIEKTVATLPRGFTANPSLADRLEVCSEAQVARETASSAPGEGCPDAAKIGTVEVETPLLEDQVLKGALYVAEPYENPFSTLIALYVVIKDAELGIKVVQPLKVEPDPSTGQLITTAEAMPQLPFSHFRLHFREGGRSPLISPPECGAYDGHDSSHEPVKAVLYPSSGGPPVESTSSFEIVAGPDGGPCPSGAAPFHPGFGAGTLNNAAGTYSPLLMRLTRGDGEQDMSKFSFVLPPGVVPKLAGIPYCSEAGIARARSRTGAHGAQEELQDPSCPAASQIGRTVAGAGVGSQLIYVPGSLYLAGPYHGDPISAVAITPAKAGPFDAGTVVVREALRLNPVTHVGEVDGSASDPIPHILKGIPLNLRDLRVYADRPEFTLNPTSCEPFEAQSTIWGDGTALVPTGETPVTLSARFQAADCASLGFKPKLGLKLRGGTKRGKFPALHAVYSPRGQGDANLSRLALTFPNSEFIEQGHFRTICTRVQFAAGAGFGSQCPKGSIYGHIKVWTPLLDEPLQGPVYLRSSDHNLPDAVFALHGPVDIELATRIDSTHGRLRAIVQGAPDAPVSRAVVDMQGGQKGLFVNSRNLCVGKNRARANTGAQNGRRNLTKPLLRPVACGKHRVKRHRRHHRRGPGGRGA